MELHSFCCFRFALEERKTETTLDRFPLYGALILCISPFCARRAQKGEIPLIVFRSAEGHPVRWERGCMTRVNKDYLRQHAFNQVEI
jgi:hypothetical protein